MEKPSVSITGVFPVSLVWESRFASMLEGEEFDSVAEPSLNVGLD